MLFQLLKFPMFLSWKQSFRTQRRLSFLILQYLVAFFVIVITVMTMPLSLRAQKIDDSLFSQGCINSYILKEIGSSKVLMAKDVDRPVSPASLTKILTCIIAIESGRLDQDVLITKESTMVEPSKAGFRQGDKIKLLDLVKAAMVNSSNDAAFAIAIYLSGSVDSFVASMNYKAKMIGMKNSWFTNPAGFDKGIYTGNISTAGDLLRLTEYAVRNPMFNHVARLEKAIFMEQTTHKVYVLRTHNKLLDKYPYAVGIKTGYTTKAGGCLIARAIKDNKDILLVMLNAKTDRWNVASNMFDRAFLADSPASASWFNTVSRDDSRSSANIVVNEHSRTGHVNKGHKSKKQMTASLKHSRKSKKELVASLKANRKSKKEVIASLKSNRKSKKEVIASLKSNRKSKKEAIASLKGSRKSKKEMIAVLKNSRNLKKHELVASKPVRKNKKKATLSYHRSIRFNQICSHNDQAYRNVAA
ncbi:MAG: D-alanyl-D-alanine carboxypeptidase [Chlorobium sp.]|nr:MAG: D-alanyl-D-alanine carboxypeptidase [Chlorobium sp.]